MKSIDDSMDPRTVLENSGWMRALARRLVRDAASADDVVQDTWLAWVRKPPEESAATPTWLTRVLRNFVRRRHRGDESRSRREGLSARSEAHTVAPDEMLERAEGHRRVVDAVFELPEPYRSTILFRFFEELSVKEIAARGGISADTVNTRIRRGLARLRGILDRRHGGRHGWLPALLPAGVSLTLAAGVQAAPTTTAVGSSTTALATGGIIPMKKALIAVAVTALVVGGYLVSLSGPESNDGARKSLEGATGSPRAPGDLDERTDAISPQDGEPESPAVPDESDAPGAPLIVGTITDETGSPVPGARVIALPVAEWESVAGFQYTFSAVGKRDHSDRLQLLIESYRRKAATLPRTSSAEDGSYSFSGLSKREHRLLVAHDDYLPYVDGVALAGDPPPNVDVVLVAARAITGRVVDERGTPVAGARVTAALSEERALGGDARLHRLLANWKRGQFLVTTRESESVDSGEFRIGTLTPRSFDLHIEKDGHPAAWLYDVPAGAVDLTVTLTTGTVIRGVVLRPDGSALPDADVLLVRSDRPRSPRAGLGVPIESLVLDPREVIRYATSTRDAGTFAFTGLRAGEHQLEVRSDGFPRHYETIPLTEVGADLSITLSAGTAISGRVLDAYGAPVAGATVWIEEPTHDGGVRFWGQRSYIPEIIAESETNGSGGFLIEGAGEGTFRVWASAADHAPRFVDNVATGARDVTVTLAGGLVITGRVIDRVSREPIAGARVEAAWGTTASAIPGKVVTSGNDGGFEMRGAPEKRVSLIVTHPTDPRQRRVMRGFRTDQPVEVELAAPHRIAGRVIDDGGEPVAGAQVRVHVLGSERSKIRLLGPGQGLAHSRRDGSFEVEVKSDFFNSRIEISATRSGVGRGSTGMVLANEAAGTFWEIALEPAVTLQGTITDAAGSAVTGATVNVLRKVETRSAERRSVYSGAAGDYAIEDLIPGRYDIVVKHMDYASESILDVEVDFGAEQNFVLTVGRSAAGRVVDVAGLGVADAEVIVVETSPKDHEGDINEFPRAAQRRYSATPIAVARTDAAGRYVLDHLPEVGLMVFARRSGFEPSGFQFIEGVNVRDLVLVRYGSVSGTVVGPDGFPVSSFKMAANKADSSSFSAGLVTPRVFTTRDGRFFADSILPGDYELVVSAEGLVPWGATITVEAGRDASVSVRLERGLTLSGSVHDSASGDPIPGVRVFGHCRAPDAIENRVMMEAAFSAITGPEGTFELTGLRAAEYSLYYNHRGFTGDEDNVRFEVPRDAALELTMTPAGVLQGTVTIVNPPEVSFETMIKLVRTDVEQRREPLGSVSRENGEYVVSSVPPGTYDVFLVQRSLAPDAEIPPGGAIPAEMIDTTERKLGSVEITTGGPVLRDFVAD